MNLNELNSGTPDNKLWLNPVVNNISSNSTITDNVKLNKVLSGDNATSTSDVSIFSKTTTNKIYIKDNLGNEKMLLDSKANTEETVGSAVIYNNGLPQVATSSGAYVGILNGLTPGIGSLTFPANTLNNNDMYRLTCSGQCSFALATTLRFGVTFNDIFFKESNIVNIPNAVDSNMTCIIYLSFYSKNDVPDNILCNLWGDIVVHNGPTVRYLLSPSGPNLLSHIVDNTLDLRVLTATPNPATAIRTLYTTFERIN